MGEPVAVKYVAEVFGGIAATARYAAVGANLLQGGVWLMGVVSDVPQGRLVGLRTKFASNVLLARAQTLVRRCASKLHAWLSVDVQNGRVSRDCSKPIQNNNKMHHQIFLGSVITGRTMAALRGQQTSMAFDRGRSSQIVYNMVKFRGHELTVRHHFSLLVDSPTLH